VGLLGELVVGWVSGSVGWQVGWSGVGWLAGRLVGGGWLGGLVGWLVGWWVWVYGERKYVSGTYTDLNHAHRTSSAERAGAAHC
jgi:hypothetical protein